MTGAAQLPTLLRPSSPSAAERVEELESFLLAAARERGYPIDRGRCHPGHWRFIIQNADVEWLIYERGVQRKVPLTKEEQKSRFFLENEERGWKRVLVPSGWLVLLISGDYQSQIRIEERARAPFVASEIFARLEQIGAYGAAERTRRNEEEREQARRSAERLRSRQVEDSRWKALNAAMNDLEKARRFRHFIDTISSHSPQRPDQERRVRKWKRWATAQADSIDPMLNGFDDLLARLGFPKE
jgi:hypothetical protein